MTCLSITLLLLLQLSHSCEWILDLISRPWKNGVMQPLLTEVFGICRNWESKRKIKVEPIYFYSFILKTGKISSWFGKLIFSCNLLHDFWVLKRWHHIFVFCLNWRILLIFTKFHSRNYRSRKFTGFFQVLYFSFTCWYFTLPSHVGIALLSHMLALYFFLTYWYCSLLLHVGIVLFSHMLVLYSSLTCWYCILVSHFNILLFSHMLVFYFSLTLYSSLTCWFYTPLTQTF